LNTAFFPKLQGFPRLLAVFAAQGYTSTWNGKYFLLLGTARQWSFQLCAVLQANKDSAVGTSTILVAGFNMQMLIEFLADIAIGMSVVVTIIVVGLAIAEILLNARDH